MQCKVTLQLVATICLAGFTALYVSGCGSKPAEPTPTENVKANEASDEHNHDHADHDHDEQAHAEEDSGHTHAAPHDGVLVPLGDHFANIEFVFLKEEGRLTAYVLDAHASAPVRITNQDMPVEISLPDGRKETLWLDAVANALTGETVGDTSEFVTVSDALKGLEAFDGAVPAITVMGMAFENVKFKYP
ncbi:MAG: hypothetical protein AMXMBFR84_50610 [Candidatus Hydrogenedentota bacterium]